MYFSKILNVFVQRMTYICPNYKIQQGNFDQSVILHCFFALFFSCTFCHYPSDHLQFSFFVNIHLIQHLCVLLIKLAILPSEVIAQLQFPVEMFCNLLFCNTFHPPTHLPDNVSNQCNTFCKPVQLLMWNCIPKLKHQFCSFVILIVIAFCKDHTLGVLPECSTSDTEALNANFESEMKKPKDLKICRSQNCNYDCQYRELRSMTT